MVEASPYPLDSLTGAVSVRRGWFGRLIPQVEVRRDIVGPWPCSNGKLPIHSTVYFWRDMTMSDYVSLYRPVFTP